MGAASLRETRVGEDLCGGFLRKSDHRRCVGSGILHSGCIQKMTTLLRAPASPRPTTFQGDMPSLASSSPAALFMPGSKIITAPFKNNLEFKPRWGIVSSTAV
jgi:hypothetical protein